MGVLCVYLNQTTSLFQLPDTPKTLFALDKATNDFTFARNICRYVQRKIRTACGKRPVTTPTDHSSSTDQTAGLPEDRPVSPGARCARMVRTWKQALFVVQPETILRGPHELFRLFWKRKSKARSKRVRLSLETITLIKDMAATNRRLVS
jgi:hypothetical protein